jgi:hypothetical protein
LLPSFWRSSIWPGRKPPRIASTPSSMVPYEVCAATRSMRMVQHGCSLRPSERPVCGSFSSSPRRTACQRWPACTVSPPWLSTTWSPSTETTDTGNSVVTMVVPIWPDSDSIIAAAMLRPLTTRGRVLGPVEASWWSKLSDITTWPVVALIRRRVMRPPPEYEVTWRSDMRRLRTLRGYSKRSMVGIRIRSVASCWPTRAVSCRRTLPLLMWSISACSSSPNSRSSTMKRWVWVSVSDRRARIASATSSALTRPSPTA